jgi:peptidoglycan hydrolase-like protein with peptidoglycan-binding domain
MAWRNCVASVTFIAAINQRWPKRDRKSDGTIGDAAHASRDSDHNPWVIVDDMGVVRARDLDKDGINAAQVAERLRRLGEAGDPRLAGGGYVIFNRRITSPDFKRWVEYTGPNPHTAHIHVSFSRNRAGFDSPKGWWVDLFGSATPAPAKPPPRPAPRPSGARPSIKAGANRPGYIRQLQTRLRTMYPAYARNLAVDGVFGPATTAAVREFQRRSGLPVDGEVDTATWRALGF